MHCLTNWQIWEKYWKEEKNELKNKRGAGVVTWCCLTQPLQRAFFWLYPRHIYWIFYVQFWTKIEIHLKNDGELICKETKGLLFFYLGLSSYIIWRKEGKKLGRRIDALLKQKLKLQLPPSTSDLHQAPAVASSLFIPVILFFLVISNWTRQ